MLVFRHVEYWSFSMLKRAIFQHFFNKPTGLTFVQIGAHDGYYQDFMCYWIKKYQWRGVLVEPIEEKMVQCKKFYKGHHDRLKFEQCAVADSAGDRDFFYIPLNPVSSGLRPTWDKCAGLVKEGKFETRRVQCKTFHGLLEEHGMDMPQIVCMDTEGYDYHIIKTIDFSMGKPLIIIYEFKNKLRKLPENVACHKLLKEQGYKFYQHKNNLVAHRVSWKG